MPIAITQPARSIYSITLKTGGCVVLAHHCHQFGFRYVDKMSLTFCLTPRKSDLIDIYFIQCSSLHFQLASSCLWIRPYLDAGLDETKSGSRPNLWVIKWRHHITRQLFLAIKQFNHRFLDLGLNLKGLYFMMKSKTGVIEDKIIWVPKSWNDILLCQIS